MTAPVPNRTRFAQRSHSRVAYDPGDDTATSDQLPVVVLLHDLLADRSVWFPLRDVLSPHYRVLIPDTRGHSASPTLSNQWYTVAELSADVLAVLDAEDVSQVHLVGHGLGGVTALELALRVPGRLKTLTLIDPALQTLADGSPDAIARDALQQLRSNDRAAADAAYKQLFERALDTYWRPRRGVTWRESLTKAQLGAMRRHTPALAALLPALDAYKVDNVAIRDATCPTLIIVSASTSRLDSVASARLVELLPQATLATRTESGTASHPTGVTTDDVHHQIRTFISRESD